MIKKRKSLFERLTGSIRFDEDLMEDDDVFAQEEEKPLAQKDVRTLKVKSQSPQSQIVVEEEDAWQEEEGQLTVDVYQTPGEIIVQTMVAGVRPEDLGISITRDSIVIKGRREENRAIPEQDYFTKELYWGAFSRTIILPQEIEPERAEAIEKHGLLTIRLPKIDKDKQTTIKVKSL
ncbi:MAG: Hsp20/alpha crystallin family protein [Candidatus Nomurabacteria bacterium]|nr:MAG: Hsp20/alpha crystallin family protein [Candidatus Nomurabacteria bacterium]